MTRISAGRWWLGVLVAAALVAALAPAWLGDADLGDVTVALTRGALAAAAAVALAVGRPSLAVAGLGGVAGYASGYAAMHGWAVPVAMLAGIGLAVLASLVLGLLGARLGAAAFVALTLVAALAGGALVDALPDTLGGATGLQPVPPFSVPLLGGDTLAFGPAGTLHVALLLVTAAVVVCALVLLALPGARWRAIGGDAERSRDAGLRPLRGTLAALAVSGALAGLGGVFAVHATGVATPSVFSADAAVLPLLAAMVAARGGVAAAALVGAGTAAVGLRVLPALGWTGPPGAEALATGVLAVVALLVLPGLRGRAWAVLRRRDGDVAADSAGDEVAAEPGAALRRHGGDAAADGAGGDVAAEPGTALRRQGGDVAADSTRPAQPPGEATTWPDIRPAGAPAALLVRDFAVVPEPGAAPLSRVDMAVPAGTVQGLVGPNGAGKSTALRGIAAHLRRAADPSVRLDPGGRAVLLPQAGGGWPSCTVDETLRLAARAGGLHGRAADAAAAEWSGALDLGDAGGLLCEDLAHGTRRRVEMARVMLLRPVLLLCDEPLAGLDGADRALVLDCLRAAAAAGMTLVVAEHDRASLARIATATTELRRLDLEPPAATEPAPA